MIKTGGVVCYKEKLTTTGSQRLYDKPLLCSNVYVYAEDFEIYIGRQGMQEFLLQPIAAFDDKYAIKFDFINLNDLWVRAGTANAILHVIGTTVAEGDV